MHVDRFQARGVGVSGRHPDQTVPVPVNLQTWSDLAFLHFVYERDAVQRLLPEGLRVQSWDGVTWVGLTPFRMVDVRVPGLPPPPGWGVFPELNVRAYVEGPDGRDGLWFLGMLVPRTSFLVALRAVGLPYAWSEAEARPETGRWGYRFGTPWRRRPSGEAWFSAEVAVGSPLAEGERTAMLESICGRWSAYHRRAGVLWRTPVEHEPWPLHHASVSGRVTSPLRWVGLPEPDRAPMVHAAPAVHARLGPPRPAWPHAGS
jgi:uncharacterized protein